MTVPVRRSSTSRVVSLFRASERLSKFMLPILLHIPSTTNVLACIMVSWYSNRRTPSDSSAS
jgi:hypothetical protein